MTAPYDRIYTAQKVGFNRDRIIKLENAYSNWSNSLVWVAIANITITEFSHSAGDPTISSFGGSYVKIPTPGNDPSQTSLTHLIFNVTLGALGSSTIGQVWEFNFDLGDGTNSIQLYGNGRLLHTEPDGSLITYDLAFSPDSDAIFATVAGVEPSPSDIGAGDVAGFLRATYPCVIAEGDQFQGWLWGLTQIGGD